MSQGASDQGARGQGPGAGGTARPSGFAESTAANRLGTADDAGPLRLRGGGPPPATRARDDGPLALPRPAPSPLFARPPRRTRTPTQRAVRAAIHPSLTPPRFRPEGVLAPVSGLPDVPEPAAPPRRKPPAAPPVLVPAIPSTVPSSVTAPASVPAPGAVDDPYAPLGLRHGGMVYYPSIGESVGYDTNPDRVSPKRSGSAVLRTEGEFAFRSDWSANEFAGELRGGYNAYPGLRGADRPDGEGSVRLRLDANRDTRIDLEGRYRIDTQRAGSPDLANAAVVERPLVASFGGSAGVTEAFNRLSVGIRGSIDRDVFEDARLANGATLIQSDRDATQYGLRLRAAYEVTPGLAPFADILLDTRVHDDRVDTAGYRRDSDGVGFKVGSTFEISRILTGEISGGLQRRDYVDPRLRTLVGPVAAGALAWAVTPLTTVRLRGEAGIAETDVPGASGIETQRTTLELQHDLRRNLSLTFSGTLLANDYRGVAIHETGYAAGVRGDYRVTRFLTLRASFLHEDLRSTVPNSSYSANTYLLGLRWNP